MHATGFKTISRTACKLSTPSLQLGTRRWQPDLSACDLVGTPITPGLRYRDVEIVTLRTRRLRQEFDIQAGRLPFGRECLNSLRLMHIIDIFPCARRLGPPRKGRVLLQLIAMNPDLNKTMPRA